MSLWLGNKKIRQVGVVFTKGDTSNLQPSNIKSGVSILGITGTFSSSSSLNGGENAATSSNIMTGYSAFIDGEKIEGSLDVKNYYVGTSEPPSSLGNDGDIYLKK